MAKTIRLREALSELESVVGQQELRLTQSRRVKREAYSYDMHLEMLHDAAQAIRNFLNSGQALVLAIHLRLDTNKKVRTLTTDSIPYYSHYDSSMAKLRSPSATAAQVCEQLRDLLSDWEMKVRYTPARNVIHDILNTLAESEAGSLDSESVEMKSTFPFSAS